MEPFVDHLQILPMPFRDGARQPDGQHRPGGLGMATLSDLLNARGWTARVEDMGFDKPMPETRLAEAFARAIGDGVESAWERRRFPVVLSRAGYAAVGVIDALGERTGIVWASGRGDYRTPGLLRRPRLDATALALLTGRARRDPLAVRPVRASGARVIAVGTEQAGDAEHRAMIEDGIRIVAPREVDRLPGEVAATDADGWYLHVDCSALVPEAVPGADPSAGGRGAGRLSPGRLLEAIGEAFDGERPLRAVAVVAYDLNRDPTGTTTATLLELVEGAAIAAGGVPRPETGATVRG